MYSRSPKTCNKGYGYRGGGDQGRGLDLFEMRYVFRKLMIPKIDKHLLYLILLFFPRQHFLGFAEEDKGRNTQSEIYKSCSE